jgi:ankyrin repeat protein
VLCFLLCAGHYKYPPAEIPALLIQSGANLEAKDANGRTALQVALLSGWQNIAELLIKNNAQTGAVPGIKASITCPDCKRIVATYNL